jgi:ERO1-like protein alpha
LEDELVEDTCELKTLAQVNHEHLKPLLGQLVRQTFFKYFKLNLYQDCPFWVQEMLCGLQGGCNVCECDENEIPLPWKVSSTDKVSSVRSNQFSQRWDEDDDDEESKEKHDLDLLPWIWSDPLEEQCMSYVNLLDNPETNTGYSEGASNIWKAIYEENCFKPITQSNSSHIDVLEGLCFEERVFYRLVSGLHTSVSVHIAEFFEQDPDSGAWRRNDTEFWLRAGNHPDRIRNLYFTYVFLLRAAYRASFFLENYDFHTGNAKQDKQVKDLMRRFLHNELRCEPTFDERQLFDEEEREGSPDELHRRASDKHELKREFKEHFRNISRIMDCVGCEKCKIHGKLQILGLGTALKILLEDRTCETLQRNEIIALVNTLYKFATSAEVVARYLSLVKDEASATTAKEYGNATAGVGRLNRLWQLYDDAPKDLLLGLLVVGLMSIMGVVRLVIWRVERRQADDADKKNQ